MQVEGPFPLTPALSPGERERRRAIRVGGTVWCMRPRTGRRSKAGSPLRSAPALHRVKLYRSGLAVTMQLDAPFPSPPPSSKHYGGQAGPLPWGEGRSEERRVGKE